MVTRAPASPTSAIRSLFGRWHPAVLLLWAGLVAAAALSAAAVEVYGESGTQCDGLLQPREAIDAPTCADFYEKRATVVAVLLVVAALLAIAAAASAVARRELGAKPTSGDRDVDLGVGVAVTAGLVAPLAYVVLAVLTYLLVVDQGGLSSVGLPDGWQHVGHGAGVVAACLLLGSTGLSRASRLAAAAVGVPAVLLVIVVAGHLLQRSDVDESARTVDNLFVWIAAGTPVVLALLVVADLQRRGRAAPGELVSAALVCVSLGVTTVALMPQILPSHRDAKGGGPYPFRGFDVEVWLPLMLVPLVLSVLVVWATYAYAGRQRSER